MTFKEFLEGIANAIRSKKGTTGAIKPINFASEIESIEVGSGGSQNYKTSGSFKLKIPKSVYGLVYYSLTNGEITPNINPLWAWGVSEFTISGLIVGSDISFVTTNTTTARTVSVTGGASVKTNSSGNIIIHIDSATDGTITIS